MDEFAMKNDNKVITGWNQIWDQYQEPNYFGRMLHRQRIKTLGQILKRIKLPLGASIVDVGCGSGSTLSIFRSLGYYNAVGVDGAENALLTGQRLYNFIRGKDTFLADAKDISFGDKSYTLVFSQGLLEHYQQKTEALEIVREICRLSGKYVLLLQPDQGSLFGVAKRLYDWLGRSSWEKEYSYSKKDYIELLQSCGFLMIDSGSNNFKEEMWLLFSLNEG